MEEDWDLQAIVRRGCSNSDFVTIMDDNNQQHYSSTSFLGNQQEEEEDGFLGLANYYYYSDCAFVDHNVEELYKPFYYQVPPQQQQQLPSQTKTITTTTTSLIPIQQLKQTQQPPHDIEDDSLAAAPTNVPIPKRRKNQQQKRVVQQVTADGLSSDTWAWRKYGQKPIKGSPYPRSYYRCSSSKGCLARKLVERSSSDPTMFIITYTAEHCHTQPIRRNCLAGIGKKKSSTTTTTSSTTTTTKNHHPNNKESSCCSPVSTTTALSPTTPLMACIEDEFSRYEQTKEERMEEELNQDSKENKSVIFPNMMMPNSALILGFDEGLDGLTSDMADFDSWFSNHISETFHM